MAYPDLNAGLAARFLFTESSGPAFADISGNGYDLAIGGGFDASDYYATGFGVFASSALLDGDVNQDIRNATPTGLLVSKSAVAISAWVQTTEPNYAAIAFCARGDSATSARLAILLNFNTADGKVTIGARSNDDDGLKSVKSTSVVNDGNRHHIVGVVDYAAGWLKVYIDGKLEATNAAPGFLQTSSDSTDPLAFGVGVDGGGFLDFEGRILDVRIYERAITSDDVHALYDLGLELTDQIVADIDFAESTGTTFLDKSGNGNHAAFTGDTGEDCGDARTDGRGELDRWAMQGNDANRFCEMPNLGLTDAYTIVIPFNASQISANHDGLLIARDTTNDGLVLYIEGTTGKFHINHNANQVVTAGSVCDGFDHVAIMWCDGASVYLEIDGVLIGSTVMSAPLDISANYFIGRDSTFTQYWAACKIGRIRIWDRVLTSLERDAVRDAGPELNLGAQVDMSLQESAGVLIARNRIRGVDDLAAIGGFDQGFTTNGSGRDVPTGWGEYTNNSPAAHTAEVTAGGTFKLGGTGGAGTAIVGLFASGAVKNSQSYVSKVRFRVLSLSSLVSNPRIIVFTNTTATLHIATAYLQDYTVGEWVEFEGLKTAANITAYLGLQLPAGISAEVEIEYLSMTRENAGAIGTAVVMGAEGPGGSLANAATFTRANANSIITTPATYAPGGSFVAAAWVYPTQQATMLAIGTRAGGVGTNVFFGLDGGTKKLFCYTTAFSTSSNKGPVMEINAWQHIAVSYNATLQILRMWLDGLLSYELAGVTMASNSAAPISIGQDDPISQGWNGRIAGAYWANRPGDYEDVQQLMRRGLIGGALSGGRMRLGTRRPTVIAARKSLA